jgi:hypothetical protein
VRTGKPQNPHDLEQSLHTGGGKNKKHEGSTETPRRRQEDTTKTQPCGRP